MKNKELLKAYRSMECTVNESCLGQVVAHHLRTKGAGGPDSPENLMPLCARHHKKIHDSGVRTFIDDYQLELEMINRGWEIVYLNDECPGKWIRKL